METHHVPAFCLYQKMTGVLIPSNSAALPLFGFVPAYADTAECTIQVKSTCTIHTESYFCGFSTQNPIDTSGLLCYYVNDLIYLINKLR